MHLDFFLFLVVIFTADIAAGTCMHGTSLYERTDVKASTFGYSGLWGPLNWAALSPDNYACADSAVKSPINIDCTTPASKNMLKMNIETVPHAEFENLGTTLEVTVNGTTTVNGKDHTLKQLHFHTPSEHRLNDEYFPLEMHMVHEAEDGALFVLAVLFELSANCSTTELLTAVTENIRDVSIPGATTETGALDFAELIHHLETTPLFHYSGSLTTPPCAAGVSFFVTQQPLLVNAETFLALKHTIKFNSRYTQNVLGGQNLLQVVRRQGMHESRSFGSWLKSVTRLRPIAKKVSPIAKGLIG